MSAVKFKHLRSNFLSGLILLAPVGVTVFVINFLLSVLGRPFSKLFFFYVDDATFERYPWMGYLLTVVSACIVVVMITLFGWFSRKIFGRFFVAWFEKFMGSVPLVRSVYVTVRQIVDTVAKSNKAIFNTTVLIEYPRKGVYAIGFLTGDAQGEIQEKTSAYLLNVFLPTTPNPTSGFLLLVPKEEVILLDMPVADGMKAIISGGAVMPQWLPKKEESLPETGEAK